MFIYLGYANQGGYYKSPLDETRASDSECEDFLGDGMVVIRLGSRDPHNSIHLFAVHRE